MTKYRRTGIAVLLVGIVAVGFGLAHTPTVSAKGGKTPPTIDDLVGVYQEKEKAQDYDLLSSASEKYTDQGTVTITKLDSETVNLHFDLQFESFNDVGYYGGAGTIVTGFSDDTTLGSYCYLQVIKISGSPGKLKGKGTWTYYDIGDGYHEMGSFTLKQLN